MAHDVDRRQSLNVLRFPGNHKSVRSLVLADVERLVELLLVVLLAFHFESLHVVGLLAAFL